MKTLEQISAAVRTLSGYEVRFGLLNVRVMLRTGVNLKAIRRDQNESASAVRDVLSALHDLGYALEGRRHG